MIAIFQDLAATARLFPAVREARQTGASAVQVQPVFPVKEYIPQGGASWYDTMEGTLLPYNSDVERAAHAVFLTFPPALRHKLAFTPEHRGEWAERLRFWRNVLKPALSPDAYLFAILRFSAHYRKCIRRRSRMGV
ncbi:MAG: hypothetical protein LIO95_03680 [Clostridiales bacterium]|nr:hypothetical protein [Clostridiales bacterium]